MGRPRKSSTEKKRQGTYREDRDPAKKTVVKDGDKYEVIRKKLQEVENLIRDTPIDGNERKLINLSNLYQKLIDVLQVPTLEGKKKTMVDDLWKN
jgi:hypothetical protein